MKKMKINPIALALVALPVGALYYMYYRSANYGTATQASYTRTQPRTATFTGTAVR